MASGRFSLGGDRRDVARYAWPAGVAVAGVAWYTSDSLRHRRKGDQIFPAYLESIRQAEETVNMLTYAYWKGDIAIEVADVLCDRAKAGVECNVLIDAVGGAQMERRLVEQMRDAGVTFCWFRPPKPYAVRRLQYRTHRKLLIPPDDAAREVADGGCMVVV